MSDRGGHTDGRATLSSPREDADRSLRFWSGVRRALRASLAVTVVLAVWLLAFGRPDGEPVVLPDTSPQFSLDLEVIETLEHDAVYVVEQRARPGYRIFRFEPVTGEDTTIFTVPEDAIIYGIDLSPDRRSLAVAYTPDFNLGGSGLWTLDLVNGDFEEVVPVDTGLYVTEPEWSHDGTTVLATHVDRRSAGGEQLSLAQIELDGQVDIVAENAITPAATADGIYYLIVDAEKARRSIGQIDAAGAERTISVSDDQFDLDHLTTSNNDASFFVAVLADTTESAFTVGSPADAHGNHNVASTWWSIDPGTNESGPSSLEPIIVYDAAATDDGTIVYATLEGLSVAGDERFDLIASRAIRFVAG